MIAFKPNDRPDMDEVVNNLKDFALDEEYEAMNVNQNEAAMSAHVLAASENQLYTVRHLLDKHSNEETKTDAVKSAVGRNWLDSLNAVIRKRNPWARGGKTK